MFRLVEQAGVGPVLAAGFPADFSAVARVPPQAAPRLGEHTEEVLSELLGMEQAAYGRLRERRVVG
jgi:2-methylfumaryl-CoA isomerase